MDKQEMQYLWDLTLLTSWKRDYSLPAFMFNFLNKVNKSLVDDLKAEKVTFDDVINYINGLDLKRCKDKRAGKITFVVSRKIPIRAFIGERCKRLGACLNNESLDLLDILEAIDNFEWRVVNHNSKDNVSACSKKRIRKVRAQTIKHVRARDLDTRHNWGTVK